MKTRLAILLVISTIWATGCSNAAARAPQIGPVKRHLLALYDGGQEGGNINFTRLHRFAELPLNHDGFILDFRDVRDKLPDDADLDQYRAVLTWFAGPVQNPDDYLTWADQVARRDIHFIILGDIGVAVGPDNIAVVNRLLALAGLRHTGTFVSPTLGTRIVEKDPELLEFECHLDPVLPDFPVLEPAGADTRIGLMLRLPAYESGRTTVPVAIGPRGGYAALNYEFCHPTQPVYQGRWLIDPITFFRAALGSQGEPIPDTTTASGRRIYFNLFGSEGWSRPSTIEQFRDDGATAARVVLHELIGAFPDLPTSIDLPDDAFPKSGRSALEARRIAHDILATPGVRNSRRRFEAPRSRFDAEYPSISNLSPLVSASPRIPAQRVVNTALNAGVIFDAGGATNEGDLAGLEQTFARTEGPPRLTPFNLNYQAHVGERADLLQSVRRILQIANTAALAPISADRYAAIVDGFFSARIERDGSGSWRIGNRGALQTIRFDDADGMSASIDGSVGVIGQRRVGHALYLALDEDVETAVIVMTSSKATLPGTLALDDSRWQIRHVTRGPCATRFEAQGFGPGTFSWSGASARGYLISVTQSDRELWRDNAEPDAVGQLRFAIPANAIDPVTIEIICRVSEAD
ncbi:hypothetical protein ACQR1I_27350 [Bradyrhizobium sp. HKCCYLS2038]|uniref:hypothetical protein n=1 Tax=unclassified Bradyrhizobium TaxID=2631580 RepID=UPI003EBCBC8D